MSEGLAPSASCTDAGVITMAQIHPSVSTTTLRLRPVISFPGVVAFGPALLGGLHALAVENRRGRLGRFAFALANARPQSIMNAVPRSVGLPHAEVMKNDAIRRKIMRQAPPDAAIARLIQDRVDDLAAWVL